MTKQNLQDMLKELDSLIRTEKSKPQLKEEALPLEQPKKRKAGVEDYADFFGGSDSSKTDDPLTPFNQRYATIDDLQRNYTEFLTKIQTQLASMGGGGSYELMDNRDVVYKKNFLIDNQSILVFNSGMKKFETKTLTNSLTEVEQITTSTTITSFTSTEKFIGVDCSSPCSINLTDTFTEGQKIIVKDKSGNASTNTITIFSSDLIDQESSLTIGINWGSVTLFRNNNTWSII